MAQWQGGGGNTFAAKFRSLRNFLSVFASRKPSGKLHCPGELSYSKKHTYYKMSRLNIYLETDGSGWVSEVPGTKLVVFTLR